VAIILTPTCKKKFQKTLTQTINLADLPINTAWHCRCYCQELKGLLRCAIDSNQEMRPCTDEDSNEYTIEECRTRIELIQKQIKRYQSYLTTLNEELEYYQKELTEWEKN